MHARPVRPWQHAAKWAKRRPVHAALVAVIGSRDLGCTRRPLVVSAASGTSETTNGYRRHERSPLSDERFAERYGPATQVKLVHDTFRSGNITLAAKMAAKLASSPGSAKPRGFAWGYVRQLFRPDVTLLGEPSYFNTQPC